MLLNDPASCVDASSPKPVVGCQFDLRLEPELCLAAGVLRRSRTGSHEREEQSGSLVEDIRFSVPVDKRPNGQALSGRRSRTAQTAC